MTRTEIKRLDRDLAGRSLGPEISCRPARVTVIVSRRKRIAGVERDPGAVRQRR